MFVNICCCKTQKSAISLFNTVTDISQLYDKISSKEFPRQNNTTSFQRDTHTDNLGVQIGIINADNYSHLVTTLYDDTGALFHIKIMNIKHFKSGFAPENVWYCQLKH